MTKGILFAAAFFLTGLPAYALDNGPFFVLPGGANTCGDFLDQTQGRFSDVEWIFGYISGINSQASRGQRYTGQSLPSPETAEVWVENYCHAHPLNILVQAAIALRGELLKREDGPTG